MSTGIAIIVAVLVVVFLLGLPTRRRLERAWMPRPGPHPLVRPFRAVARRVRGLRRRRERKRREHLRPL